MAGKVAFVIFGNIASGKTTLAASLVKSLPSFKVVCADDIRIASALDDSLLTEHQIYAKILEEINQHTQVILECSGAGTYFKHYLMQLMAMGFLIVKVKLDCSKGVCLQRYQNRADNTAAMVPMSHRFDIRKSIENIESKIAGLPYDLQFNTEKVSYLEITNQILQLYDSSNEQMVHGPVQAKSTEKQHIKNG